MKDRCLRTLAEMENLRKRTEREVTDARLYGVAFVCPRRAQRGRQYPPRVEAVRRKRWRTPKP